MRGANVTQEDYSIITVTVKAGSLTKTATIKVIVTPAAAPSLSVSITGTTQLVVNGTALYTASVTAQNIPNFDSNQVTYVWESNNPNVAAVVSGVTAKNAVVKGISAGYATLKVTAKYGQYTAEAYLPIEVVTATVPPITNVVQEEARKILDELDVRTAPYRVAGYYTADSVEAVSTITSKAVKAGAIVFNGISVEDVVVHEDGRIQGLVINWTAVEMAGLHVDPLSIHCKYVIDATGHDTEVVKVVARKTPGKLLTPTGNIEGEKFMSPDRAEKLTIENTREVFPGLYVAGMAANATFGGPRMGPIFGGMLLSGAKVAEEILSKL